MDRLRLGLFLTAAWGLGLAASGCGVREYRLPETGATLEGTVTYGGKSVPAAMIIVAGESSGTTGNIGENGRFQIPNVPLGKVSLAVNTDAAKGQMMGQAMSQAYQSGKQGKRFAPPPFVEVPKKYHDPNSSGITTTINKGTNSFDIVLK